MYIDAYAVPANFLEIDVVNPMTTITAGKKRFTDYEVRMRVSFELHKFICDAWNYIVQVFGLSYGYVNINDASPKIHSPYH